MVFQRQYSNYMFFYFAKVRVQVLDGGSPPLQSNEVLTVNVLRNLNVPAFGDDEYSNSIMENYNIGRSVLRVRATDADSKVCRNIVYNSYTCMYVSIPINSNV